MRKIFYYILIILFIVACGDSKPDVSSIKIDHKIIRFDQDLFALESNDIDKGINELSIKYGSYWRLYNQGIVGTGNPSRSGFAEYLKKFVYDKNIREVYDSCSIVFADDSKINRELNLAFKYLKYYYPQVDLPQVYFHISGFNQSQVVDRGLISVSIDNYLGEKSKFYDMLATPVPMYARSKMNKERVPFDVIKAFALTNFVYKPVKSNLANKLIYEGKILYFLSSLFPDASEEMIMAYTKDQLLWCEANEAMAWGFFIENNYLYNSDHFIMSKYINDAPYTSGMPTDSPGRVASWLGLQIVKSYMRSNPIKLRDLMNNNDYEEILRESNYQPQ